MVEKVYVRMSERVLESMDYIKDSLISTFNQADPSIRKICTQIMTSMLIKGSYYSWDDLVTFFLNNLDKAEKCLKAEDGQLSQEEYARDINMAENAIEGISVLVEKFVKHSEDETYYYQL